MPLQNRCQLITYADSLGRDLQDLQYCVKRYFGKAIAGIHILPFYPSSADRGFAPLTYDEVDPIFGSWEDVERIGKEYDLVVDFMVNHISRQSAYFQDFVEKGDASPYADLFLRYKKLDPSGEIPEEQLKLIYTRKPRPPYYEATLADGSVEKVWCTFDYEQIDLDVKSQVGREMVRRFIVSLARRGVKMIRVDAFGYTVKKLGTSCFFVEPDTSLLLKKLEDTVKPFDVELLPEIHEHHSIQLKLAGQGFWVYDFALPMLVLQALYEGTKRNLVNWLSICPRKQITTLDTHDGLPVVDVADLMTPEEIERLRETLFEKGANVSRRYSTDPEFKNLDIYQINCTYYSALGNDDDAYVVARAIQFFSPGIPQVYYVGLLAGENDIELVERTKHGRDINRHNYTVDEVEQAMERTVVKRLIRLMEFRNSHPAFDGDITIGESSDDTLVVTWRAGVHSATLTADLAGHHGTITYTSFATDGPIRTEVTTI